MAFTEAEKPVTEASVNGLQGVDHAGERISLIAQPSPNTQDAKRVRPRGLSHSEKRYLLFREREGRLAARIRSYWHRRGADVEVWLEPLNTDKWQVRSSLRLTARPRP
jgi:hypothetical protein